MGASNWRTYKAGRIPFVTLTGSVICVILGSLWLWDRQLHNGASYAMIALLVLLICGLLWMLFAQLTRLHQSRENLRLTISSTTDIVFILDSKARYVEIFATSDEQLLAKREDLIGCLVRMRLGDELGARVETLVVEVLATGEKRSISYPLEIHGRTMWFENVISKRDSDTVVVMVRDMTERKMMESQLEEQRARQIAASRMASLGQMAGSVAHEINNPLAIISGYSGRLIDVLNQDPIPRDRALDIVNRIDATTTRVAAIIKGLRTISRDGSLDPMESVSADVIVNDVLGLCAERFITTGVILETQIDPDLKVNCRSVQLCQVLLNLLTNAFFAVAKLPNAKIKVEASKRGNWIEIAVTDSGDGIDPKHREKIFEPFFTTKPVGAGTGLGLSIGASIVRGHGGELLLDATSSNTRFVIRLPIGTTAS